MRVLGVVQWTGFDKRGQIAGVRPLFDVTKPEWNLIDAAEEFPENGEIFWPNALKAMEGALVTFRPEPNVGQKHQFRVGDPKLELTVVDLRRFGDPTAARAALVSGKVHLPGSVGQFPALVLCADDVLVGPVEVTRVATGTVKLSGRNLAKVPTYSGFTLRPIAVSANEQKLLRVDEQGPTGYVDWDEDGLVVRRALEIAVRVAKKGGADTGQTKRQIEEAANALAALGVGVETQLEQYRVERALAVCRSSGAVVATLAPDLIALLQAHPAVEGQLDAVKAKVRAHAELVARAEIETELTRELYELNEVKSEHERTKTAIGAAFVELKRLNDQAEDVRQRVKNAAKEIEVAVDERLLRAIEKPFELLAEVSVLRPFLATRAIRDNIAGQRDVPSTIDWSRTRGAAINEKVALKRALIDAARARGVDPQVMTQVHAAVAAGLLPVTIGPSALATMAAYAQAACGGRLAVFHVSPGVLHPRELAEVPGGVTDASAASKDIDGLSLLVFEGANRAPIEASLLPLLQLSGLAPAGTRQNLRLAASLVTGATTVPVTSQLWSYAVALYPGPQSPTPQSNEETKEVSSSSELFALGDVPREQVDSLMDEWPECSDLKPTLERFGAALNRFCDAERITEYMLQGLILPYLVTALSAEDQEDVLARMAGEENAQVLRRLRRGLC
jgi:hypothetical protein